jgi:hypothetical protein
MKKRLQAEEIVARAAATIAIAMRPVAQVVQHMNAKGNLMIAPAQGQGAASANPPFLNEPFLMEQTSSQRQSVRTGSPKAKKRDADLDQY